jgi:hypothetical protein
MLYVIQMTRETRNPFCPAERKGAGLLLRHFNATSPWFRGNARGSELSIWLPNPESRLYEKQTALNFKTMKRAKNENSFLRAILLRRVPSNSITNF